MSSWSDFKYPNIAACYLKQNPYLCLSHTRKKSQFEENILYALAGLESVMYANEAMKKPSLHHHLHSKVFV